MDEITNRGGAGMTSATHGKDTSAPGNDKPAVLTATPGVSDGKSWHDDPLGKIGNTLTDLRVQAANHLTGHVRETPLLAVAVTGVIFLAAGLLLGRR